MSNVIAFLEQMGKNPALASQSPQAYATAVDALGLDEAPRQALLERDTAALNDSLGGRLKMMCFLFPADGEGQEKNDEEPDAEGDQPSEDDQKESIHRHGRH